MHHLMSYFLSNTSAKNYRNRIVCVKITASQKWDVFETHSRSTGTVHTSAKARLSWLSCRGRCRNDVLVAMAIVCPALQRLATQSVDATFRIFK